MESCITVALDRHPLQLATYVHCKTMIDKYRYAGMLVEFGIQMVSRVHPTIRNSTWIVNLPRRAAQSIITIYVIMVECCPSTSTSTLGMRHHAGRPELLLVGICKFRQAAHARH